MGRVAALCSNIEACSLAHPVF